MKLALLLLTLPLGAQDFSQRGYLDLRGTFYPQTTRIDSGQAIGDVLLRYEAAYKLTPWLKFNGAVDGRTDTHRQTEREFRLDWDDRGRLRPAISLRRFSFLLHQGGLTLEAGKQFIRWGKADILNPVDRFAPRDFVNVVDTDYLGVLAARLTVEHKNDSFEFVAQPRFTPSRTPLLNQRWSGITEFPIAVTEGPPRLPGGTAVGARWNHLGKGYEASAILYRGHNHLPLFDAQLLSPAAARISAYYAQMTMYGTAAAVPLPWFTVKGEAGYFTSSTDTADHYLLYVVQAERQSGEWSFVGGYSGEAVTRRRTQFDFAPDRGLSRSFLGRASFTIDANRSVAFEAAVRQNGDGVWLKSEYTQTLSPHWQARASFTLIRGERTDFLGQFNQNSHAILAMRYSY